MKNSRPWLPLVCIILLCFISRLPQLLSPHFIMDSDECIVGLMAKHMLQGKDLPLFFYGQSYGFSLIETTFISLGYCLGGISDYSVKLSMLALWTIGILFFYGTLKRVCRPGSSLPLLITILFILAPVWAAWSMKARGGYLSAFTMSWIATYILFKKDGHKPLAYILLGILLPLIYQSQALWIPGLVPLVIYHLAANRQPLRNTLLILAGIAACALLFVLLPMANAGVWHGNMISFRPASVWEKFTTMPLAVFTNLHGFYYLTDVYTPPLPNVIFALLFMAGICIALISGLVLAFKGLRKNALFFALFAALFCTLAYIPFIPANNPRYLLPIYGLLLFFTCIGLDRLDKKVLAYALILPLCLLGGVSVYLFKDLKINNIDRSAFLPAISYLKKEQVNNIFCPDDLLKWQIDFYSGEEVVCRPYNNLDRYPPYIKQGADAYNSGKRIGLLTLDEEEKLEGIPNVRIGDCYIYTDLPKEKLEALGVAFKNGLMTY